jgi:carboxyl-terminal processing protease
MSVDAAFYLNLALNTMQRVSINRSTIDWGALRAAALERAADAQTYADTYPAIEGALRSLGDGHSFFVPPVPAGGRPGTAATADSGRMVSHRFGYVSLMTWRGGDAAAYAARLQRIVAAVDRGSPCGWIVDLRSTQTRDLYPMLAGVGPILGDGVSGKIIYPSGPPAAWYYQRGSAGVIKAATRQRTALVQVARPVVLDDAVPSVAVLLGRRTASAGEAVAVSFRGRPNTRSFGRPTAGLSTYNDGFRLRDGAMLYVTTAVLADRIGQQYGGPVQPDIAVDGPDEPKPGADDPVIEAAARWLTIQPSCARAMASRIP